MSESGKQFGSAPIFGKPIVTIENVWEKEITLTEMFHLHFGNPPTHNGIPVDLSDFEDIFLDPSTMKVHYTYKD